MERAGVRKQRPDDGGEHWQSAAACAGSVAELFYPVHRERGPSGRTREQQAKQVTMQEAQVASEANERQQDALQLQMHALHMADLLYLAISGHNADGSTRQPGDRYQP